MKTFNNQIDLTAFWEGFSAKAYKCPAGVWTLGYGTTRIWVGSISKKNFHWQPITEGMGCSQKKAEEWLNIEMNLELYVALKKKLEKDAKCILNTKQEDAIKDYAYNCGINAFPTLIKKINNLDIEGASLEFLDGIYVAKKPLLGLLLRRISEYNTFVNGTYIAWEKGDPISQDLKNKLLLKNAKNQDAVDMINQFKLQGGK